MEGKSSAVGRARRLAGLFVTLVLTAPPALGQAPAPVTAFVNVAVVPMDRERVLTHQTVVVRGDRIIALGPASRVRVPADAQRIDGRGQYLIPGLGDMHTHGFAPDTLRLLQSLAQGITTVRDARAGSGPESNALQAKRAVASGALLGPRIYTAGDVRVEFSRLRMHRSPAGVTTQVPDSSWALTVADSIAALKRDGYDFVKLYGWPRPIYDSAIAAAWRVGLRLIGHVPAETGDPAVDANLARVLQDRWASIEHGSGYFGYLTGGFPEGSLFTNDSVTLAMLDTATWMRPGFHWDPAQLRAVAVATQRAGVWVVPNLNAWTAGSNMFMGAETPKDSVEASKWSKRRRWLLRMADLGYRLTKALQEAGAGLLAGFEGGGAADELQVMVEKAGLTPYQALATATRNVAVFLGTQDSTGTVGVGKRADLVLLTGNPLQEIQALASLAGVMVGGRWLARADLEARLRRVGRAP